MINLHTGLKGQFDFYVNGQHVHSQSNLILDSGLSLYASLTLFDLIEYCYLGDGTSAVDVSDTQLDNQIAVIKEDELYDDPTNARAGTEFNNNIIRYRRRFVFSPSTTVNIRELGVGPINANTVGLFSRTLYLERLEQSELLIRPYETLTIIYSLFEVFNPESPSVTTFPFYGKNLNFETRSVVPALFEQVFEISSLAPRVDTPSFGIFHPARNLELFFYSDSDIPGATAGLQNINAGTGFIRQQAADNISYNGFTKTTIYNWPENFLVEEDFSRIGRLVLGIDYSSSGRIAPAFISTFEESIIKFFFSNVTFVFIQSWGRVS